MHRFLSKKVNQTFTVGRLMMSCKIPAVVCSVLLKSWIGVEGSLDDLVEEKVGEISA